MDLVSSIGWALDRGLGPIIQIYNYLLDLDLQLQGALRLKRPEPRVYCFFLVAFRPAGPLRTVCKYGGPFSKRYQKIGPIFAFRCATVSNPFFGILFGYAKIGLGHRNKIPSNHHFFCENPSVRRKMPSNHHFFCEMEWWSNHHFISKVFAKSVRRSRITRACSVRARHRANSRYHAPAR